MKNRLKAVGAFGGGAMIALSAALLAGPVNLPSTFTAGTPAKASEVNANFTAVKTAVDDNDSRIATLKAAVDTDAARILAMETRVPPGGNIVLPDSTATTGNFLKGSLPFVHNFGDENIFAGKIAGNFTMTGGRNSGFGQGSLRANTTGWGNTAVGRVALISNTTGELNTAIGADALASNTIGTLNVAAGAYALSSNTIGNDNSAFGEESLAFNSSGNGNTASGVKVLYSNTTGSYNTAIGALSLSANLTGDRNTAVGVNVLKANTVGADNSAAGNNALSSNTTGKENTAFGAVTLYWNSTGDKNTAFGAYSLNANTTGIRNTAVGVNAANANGAGTHNVAIGSNALLVNTVGGNNIALGASAGSLLTTGSNNIDIGHSGVAGEANTMRIGSALQTLTFIAGIRNVTTGSVSGIPVLIDQFGQLGTTSSSRKVKDDIADMSKESDVLVRLRPVTFHYKSDRNPKGRTLQYGLVAEEVAEIAPELVARNAKGEIETVYYQFLAPMLLNEYQKQQRVIEAQAREIAELKKQSARIESWLTRLEVKQSTRQAVH